MTIYQSKRTAALWFVAVISLACSVFTCYMVFSMTIQDDLDGYSSLISMRIWQALFILLGNVLTLSVLWLSDRYVLSIIVTNNQQVKIKTWSMFRLSVTRTYDLSHFSDSQVHMNDGITVLPSAPIVIAPWDGIQLQNGKKLLVDTQGYFPKGYNLYWSFIHGKPIQKK